MIDAAALPDLTEQSLQSVPIERAETIPSGWYTDPRFHELDKEFIFARTWQGVGHLGRVQNSGDYFVATVADNPIIVVRGKEGELRAFYNVCRHRGGPLATQDGNAKALQCQYHGWTYLLDGSLRGVPEFDRVELFDRKDYGLIPVRLDCWEGLVFVNLADKPLPLDTIFDGIAERIAPIKLSAMKFHRRINYEANCNWKIYVDNYLEGYHVPYVHPELCTYLDYQNYGTETHRYYSLQHSPFSDKENPYGATGGEAFYYFVFPNFMLNIVPGRLQSNIVVPLAHNRTRVIFDYYYEDMTSPNVPKTIEEDMEFSDRVQHEDMEICEHVQKGLESKAYDRGRFSVEREQGVYHFQTLIKEAYRQAMQS
jgi:choline monooxygenase